MTTASLAQQLTESYVTPGQELTAVAEARPQRTLAAPYPQFDAGDRLTNTSELLEMIIIKLSSETILFTQRTSRQFRAVIANSSLLQRRLFFTTSSTTSTGANIILNPIKGCISDLQPAESRCLQI